MPHLKSDQMLCCCRDENKWHIRFKLVVNGRKQLKLKSQKRALFYKTREFIIIQFITLRVFVREKISLTGFAIYRKQMHRTRAGERERYIQNAIISRREYKQSQGYLSHSLEYGHMNLHILV